LALGEGGGSELAPVRMEIEWDGIATKVAEFLRRDFLAFHGLSRAASLKSSGAVSSAVHAFLVPSLTPDQLYVTVQYTVLVRSEWHDIAVLDIPP
jgi:hypothetical protein